MIAEEIENNKLEDIPEEVTINIDSSTRIERVVDRLQTYKKIGIQVFYIAGEVERLLECKEFIAKLSSDVSIFLAEPDRCPKALKRFIENN